MQKKRSKWLFLLFDAKEAVKVAVFYPIIHVCTRKPCLKFSNTVFSLTTVAMSNHVRQLWTMVEHEKMRGLEVAKLVIPK